ncbi:MAG: M48 family metallopeptidase [Pseudomonadota bacterium]
MADPVTMDARFFDGQSAIDQPVVVRFHARFLEIIKSDASSTQWPYDGLALARRTAQDIRLTHDDFPDAVLVLPASAGAAALEDVVPDLISGRTANRHMVRLTAIMVLITGLVSAFLFFGVPALSGPLARATSKDFERQMGENYASQINLFFRKCAGSGPATTALQPYLDDMATRGAVGFPIKFTFVNVSAPNAFALPGGHVMATRGLIDAVGDDHEAFMAVMAHELGHVKSRDGLQAFYRNAGLSFALEAITGGTGVAQQAVSIAAQINQLQHTRAQEARADETAFAIMDAVGMDPAALSRAFEAISTRVSNGEATKDAEKQSEEKYAGGIRNRNASAACPPGCAPIRQLTTVSGRPATAPARGRKILSVMMIGQSSARLVTGRNQQTDWRTAFSALGRLIKRRKTSYCTFIRKRLKISKRNAADMPKSKKPFAATIPGNISNSRAISRPSSPSVV